MKWLSEMTEMEWNIEDANTLMITVTLNNVGLKGRQYIWYQRHINNRVISLWLRHLGIT